MLAGEFRHEPWPRRAQRRSPEHSQKASFYVSSRTTHSIRLGLTAFEAHHPFNAFQIAITYPVGPVTITIDIDLSGAWGVTGELLGSYTNENVRVEGLVVPEVEATVICFAGVGLGPVSVGLSGELLLFNLQIPVTAYAEAVHSTEGDDRPPSAELVGKDFAFASSVKQDHNWKLNYGIGAGARLKTLDGKINLEARVKLGPFKKSFKKKLASWKGPETEYRFIGQGVQDTEDGLRFPPVAREQSRGIFNQSYYHADPDSLYDPMPVLLTSPPDLQGCYEPIE